MKAANKAPDYAIIHHEYIIHIWYVAVIHTHCEIGKSACKIGKELSFPILFSILNIALQTMSYCHLHRRVPYFIRSTVNRLISWI